MSVTLRAARFAFVAADAHIGPADCTVFQKIFGEFVDVKWGGVGIAPTQKSEAGRFLEAALEQLIEFLGVAALVERDFPQRAGSGPGERRKGLIAVARGKLTLILPS